MAGQKKILAISSGGGHWIQLLRLRPALEGHRVVYASIDLAYGAEVAPARFHVVGDANRWNKLGVALLALRVAWVVLREPILGITAQISNEYRTSIQGILIY